MLNRFVAYSRFYGWELSDRVEFERLVERFEVEFCGELVGVVRGAFPDLSLRVDLFSDECKVWLCGVCPCCGVSFDWVPWFVVKNWVDFRCSH